MKDKSNVSYCIGVKSSMRAINEGCAAKLLVASDADEHVLRPLLQLAEGSRIDVEYITSMRRLGQLCKIDVGAAAAVIKIL